MLNTGHTPTRDCNPEAKKNIGETHLDLLLFELTRAYDNRAAGADAGAAGAVNIISF